METLPCNNDHMSHCIAIEKVTMVLLGLLSNKRLNELIWGKYEGDFFLAQMIRIVARHCIKYFNDVSDLLRMYDRQIQRRKALVDRTTRLVNATIDYDVKIPEMLPSEATGPRAFSMLTELADAMDYCSRIEQQKIMFCFGQVLHINSYGGDCLDCPMFLRALQFRTDCMNTACRCQPNCRAYLGGMHQANLLEIYANEEGVTIDEAVLLVMKKYGLNPDEPFSPLPAEECAGWVQVKGNITLPCAPPNEIDIPFYSSSGNLVQRALVSRLGAGKVILPQTWWSCDPQFVTEVNIPSQRPFPLLNMDLMSRQPGAEVMVTDSLIDAQLNSISPTSNTIWTSWIGGTAAAPDVAWDALKNRKVTYVVIPHSGLPIDECRKTALIVLSKLKKVKVASLNVVENYDSRSLGGC